MSQTFLNDANGTRDAFCSTGGIRSLRDFADSGAFPRLRSFIRHAWTSEPRELARELQAAHTPDTHVAVLIGQLAAHAREADEVLLLTTEDTRPDE